MKKEFKIGKTYKVKMTSISLSHYRGEEVKIMEILSRYEGKPTKFRVGIMTKDGPIYRNCPVSSLEEINKPIENTLYEIF